MKINHAFRRFLVGVVWLVIAVVVFARTAAAVPPFATELVDAGGVSASLNLDSSGNPHIAYRAGSLGYARKVAGAWAIEGAAGNQGFILSVSQGLDASDNPHMAFGDGSTLRYARKSGGVWISETIGGGPGQGAWFYPTIALDAFANPHIVFGLGNNNLYYARKASGVWTIENFDGSLAGYGLSGLSIDANGNPHVCFTDVQTNTRYYAQKNNGVWAVEAIDTSPSFLAGRMSLALDASGNPKVAYHDGAMGNLKFASKSSGAWTVEIVDGLASDVGYLPSMALDRLGNPHVAYTYGTVVAPTDLAYARQLNGVWTIQIADGSPNNILWPSLAVDGAGRAHIGYYDITAGDLRYALARVGKIDETAGKLMLSADASHSASGLELLAWPNPSQSTVAISFRVPRAGPFELGVFDVSGRMIRTLSVDGASSAEWNRLDSSGREVAPGTYFLRLTTSNGDEATKRVTIVR